MIYKILSIPKFASFLIKLSLLVKVIRVGGKVRLKHLFMENDKIRLKIHKHFRHLSITEGKKRPLTEEEMFMKEDMMQKAVDIVTLERMVKFVKEHDIKSITDPQWILFEGGKVK